MVRTREGCPRRILGLRFSVLLIVYVVLSVWIVGVQAQIPPEGIYTYQIIVNDDGEAVVTINYTSTLASGSSWVFVPKFEKWENEILHGRIIEWNLGDTEDFVGIDYYFYSVLNFTFEGEDLGESGSIFEMIIRFNFTTAAVIIEPEGIFYSPQIGFEEHSRGEVEICFPQGFSIKKDEAIIIGSREVYSIPLKKPNYVRSELRTNLARVQIGFETESKEPEIVTLTEGEFTFKTVPRYEEYAWEILHLYGRIYGNLTALFNVNLSDIEIEFFIPDFNLLMAIGGYIPFTGGRLGNIHINVFFTRFAEGYIEVAAIHELVHHFLWKAGFSPQDFLWFHEGMAQYVSIEVAMELGYEGAEMIKQNLENSVSDLIGMYGTNFNFLLRWTPRVRPADMGVLYTAAYYVVSRLAERFGGLPYYARFFKLASGAHITNKNVLAYYLSLAANESVAPILNGWGFNVEDFYLNPESFTLVGKIISNLSQVYQPYRFLAEQFYRLALKSLWNNNLSRANLYLMIAVLLAESAPLLTVATFAAALLSASLLILERKGLLKEREPSVIETIEDGSERSFTF